MTIMILNDWIVGKLFYQMIYKIGYNIYRYIDKTKKISRIYFMESIQSSWLWCS